MSTFQNFIFVVVVEQQLAASESLARFLDTTLNDALAGSGSESDSGDDGSVALSLSLSVSLSLSLSSLSLSLSSLSPLSFTHTCHYFVWLATTMFIVAMFTSDQ
jgi:hypothetical protein